jgi:hypothetical protein
VDISPILFRVGDIVEAHFSFVVNPVRSNMYQMFLVLRGLALLDNNETLVCRNLVLEKVAMIDCDIERTYKTTSYIFTANSGL